MKNLILTLVGVFLCATVFAETEVLVQGGWQHTVSSKYGDNVEGVIRVEKPLIYDVNYGVEYSYHAPTYHEHYGDFEGHALMADLVYYPDVQWGKFQPYILGALGWSWWNFDRNQDLIDKGIQVDLGDSFATKAELGLNYDLGNNWSFNVAWMYFHSHVPKDSYYESDGSPANVVGADDRHGRVHVGQEETNLLFGIKKRF